MGSGTLPSPKFRKVMFFEQFWWAKAATSGTFGKIVIHKKVLFLRHRLTLWTSCKLLPFLPPRWNSLSNIIGGQGLWCIFGMSVDPITSPCESTVYLRIFRWRRNIVLCKMFHVVVDEQFMDLVNSSCKPLGEFFEHNLSAPSYLRFYTGPGWFITSLLWREDEDVSRCPREPQKAWI